MCYLALNSAGMSPKSGRGAAAEKRPSWKGPRTGWAGWPIRGEHCGHVTG